MKRLIDRLENTMNDFNLKKKLHILYIYCMLIPLIITDSVILFIVVQSERVEQRHVMENDASAVIYNLSREVENAAMKAKNIYMNGYIEEFLNRQYETPLDYVTGHQAFMKNSLFETSMGTDNTVVTIHADNDTIINGGHFIRLSDVRETEWYRYLQEAGNNSVLYFYYDQWKSSAVQPRRSVLFIRKLNFSGQDSCEKIVTIEMDYSSLVRNLDNMNYESEIYICKDNQILLSNNGYNQPGWPFSEWKENIQPDYQKEYSAYGEHLQIAVCKRSRGIRAQIWNHMPLIVFLVLINTVMPWILMRLINRSFTARVEELSKAFDHVDADHLQEISYVRGKDEIGSLMLNYNHMASRLNDLIQAVMPWILMRLINRSFTARVEELSKAFDHVDADHLQEISYVRGKDEIGSLMLNYNHMASRLNDLIQTVYKDRLREQEMDIARQNAELLALQSQVNPHFLFNALESIRMHSILKKEYETADMVGKLAVMERQNVDWSTNFVRMKKELEFVEAYLGLQKYRFGDRLSYELDIEPECEDIQIPRLTVVTFVENACVHGIESKTASCWIFVRVYRKHEDIWIEVEDTGSGMDEDKVAEIKEKMCNVSIEKLREKGRVGIINACLRLKMITDNKVCFHIESEVGIGTTIQIRMPIDALDDRIQMHR